MRKAMVIVKEIDEYGNETVKSYDKGSVKIKESDEDTGDYLAVRLLIIIIFGIINGLMLTTMLR